jgi:hypothetical protein
MEESTALKRVAQLSEMFSEHLASYGRLVLIVRSLNKRNIELEAILERNYEHTKEIERLFTLAIAEIQQLRKELSISNQLM